MKTQSLLSRLCLLPAALVLLSLSALAQTVPTVVRILAEDPTATELPPWVNGIDPAGFRIIRSGNLSTDLLVFFSVSGSATPEKDYQALVSPVHIPAGADSVLLDVFPVYDEVEEGSETVIVQLEPSPLMGPQPTYEIDPKNSFAVAEILDMPAPARTSVRIETVAPIAEETSDPLERLPLVGQFKISRTGPVANSLPVYLRWSGMAEPGKDYEAPPFVVTIPEGADSTLLRVKAIPDELTEGLETVVASIANCPPPGILAPCVDFAVDPAHSSATLFIRDDGLTKASLAITRPPDGARFRFGNDITLQAVAIDLDGYISRVEFLDSGKVIGVSELFFFMAPPPGTPILHTFSWTEPAAGTHTLTARAVRSTGEALESPPVTIQVESSPANQAPLVAITQPLQGATIPPNTPVEIVVETRDPDGYVPTVQFFENGRRLGEQTVVFIRPPEPGQTQSFSFTWKTPEPGRHLLTARAIDNSGSSTLSDPVGISVAPGLLPRVVIRATDCFAVEPSSERPLNTANFRIRRVGPTNAPLTVLYSLHGMAENGVDYETLKDFVVIPSGSFAADITIRPLADNLAEGLESVIVRLEEQPEYTLGLHRRAFAVISDRWPVAGAPGTSSGWVADGCFLGRYQAPYAGQFLVEASSDLLNWQTILTATAPDGTLDFAEEDTAAFPRRFYRVAPESAPAAADWVSDQ